MNYYIGVDRYGAYDLAHYGVLGMKWGVRRYQNPDGSLTSAGQKRYGGSTKSRYKRGKEYDKEHSKIVSKEEERLRSSSKAYKKAEKEAYRLAEKYGLDMDDGGGGNTSLYSEAQLRAAGQRYWNSVEDMSVLNDEFYDKAYKYANDVLVSKYGNTALSDIDYYQTVNGATAAAIMLSIVGGMVFLTTR